MKNEDQSHPIARVAYTFDEVAKMFGKHRGWTYRQAKAGKFKVITGYGSQMISADEVRRMLGVNPPG